jgi:hypothetical protein
MIQQLADDRANRPDSTAGRFLGSARESRASGARELVSFLVASKKWWLAPILLAVLVISTLSILGASAVAPFIYTLF